MCDAHVRTAWVTRMRVRARAHAHKRTRTLGHSPAPSPQGSPNSIHLRDFDRDTTAMLEGLKEVEGWRKDAMPRAGSDR